MFNTIVPSGFASYVRICHPGWSFDALDPNDEEGWAALRAGWVDKEKLTPVRWDDVEIAITPIWPNPIGHFPVGQFMADR